MQAIEKWDPLHTTGLLRSYRIRRSHRNVKTQSKERSPACPRSRLIPAQLLQVAAEMRRALHILLRLTAAGRSDSLPEDRRELLHPLFVVDALYPV